LKLELELGFMFAFGLPLEGVLQRLKPAHATPVNARAHTIQKPWSGKPSRPYRGTSLMRNSPPPPETTIGP
jgi:hypothetical protein